MVTQHNTTQHNTTQHNTTQHNNIIKDSLLIYKSGSFYNCYNKDATILSYLFNYKITIDNKCGFPKTVYNKVINRLEEEKISYQVISKDENPIVKDYKNINNYDNFLIKATRYVDFRNKKDWIKHKVDKISDIESLERFYQKLKDELF